MSGKAAFQPGVCLPLRTFLADDLTGAMDTGVQVAGQTGNPVFCLWHPEKIAALPPDATIVVDTESRNLPAAEAIAAIRTTMDALLSVNRTVDYKKIDSTMRGHVAEELAEILRFNPRRGTLICPALPAQGRSVNHGTLYVDGIPLSETDLAHDPLFSLSSSYLPDLLASLGAVSLLPDEACRIPGLLAQGIQVFTADAATISDLEMWAMAASSYDLLPVGSAGLASAWTEAGTPPVHADLRSLISSPAAIVCGTPAMRTMTQVAYLLGRLPELAHVHPGREALLAPDSDPARAGALQEACLEIKRVLAGGRDVLVNVVHVAKGDILAAEGSPRSARLHADRILQGLSVFAESLDDARTLIFLGGDTARVLLDASGAAAMEILGEVLPQIPIARIRGGRWDGKTVITKAGGFGDPDTLSALLAMRG